MQQRQHDEEEKAFCSTMEHSVCRGRGNSVLDHENGRIHEMGSFQGNGLRSSGISYFTPAASTSRPPTMTSSYVPYSYSYDPVRGFSATNEARDGYGLGSGAYTSAMNRFGDETQWKRQAESEANCCSRCSACSSVKETPKWQLSQDEIQQKSNPLQGRDLMEKYKIEDDKQFRPYSPDTKSVLTRLIGYKGESVNTLRPSYKSCRSSEFTKIDSNPHEKQYELDKENNVGSYFHQHNMYPKSSKPYETHTIYMNNNPISIKSVTLNSKYDPAARYERSPEEPNNFFKRVRMGRLYGDKTPWEYYLHYDENDRSRDSYQSLKAKMDEYNSRMQSKEDRKNKIVMDTDEFRKMVDNLSKKSVSSQETQTSTQQEENCMTTNPSQPTPVLVPTANSMVLEEELTSNSARSSPKGALSKKKKELKKRVPSVVASEVISIPSSTTSGGRVSPSTAPPTSTHTSRLNQLSDLDHSKHPRIIVTKPTSSKKSKLDPTSSTKSKNKAMTKPERINTTTSYYSNCSSSSASSKSTRSSMITEGPEKQKQKRKTSVTSKPVLTTDKRFEKSMKRMQSTKKKAETVDKYINLLASPDKKLVKERMESCSRHSSPSSKSTNSMITSTTTSAHLCDEQDSSQLGKEYDEICSVFPSTVSTAVATSKTVQKCFDDVLKYFEKHKFDSALKENASDLEDVTLSSFSEDTDILAKYHTSDYEDNEELDEKFFEQASDFSDNESYDEFTQDTENLMLNASNLSISSNCSIDTISMSSSRDEISIAVSSHL